MIFFSLFFVFFYLFSNDIEDEELPGLILSKATAPSPGRMLFW